MVRKKCRKGQKVRKNSGKNESKLVWQPCRKNAEKGKKSGKSQQKMKAIQCGNPESVLNSIATDISFVVKKYYNVMYFTLLQAHMIADIEQASKLEEQILGVQNAVIEGKS